jgi:CitMHS family citrate-Mg2+:H+ or citrate-Ca2+:H+ symporter
MSLAIIGILMIVIFMVLILTKRMTAFAALAIVPVIAGLAAGCGLDTFKYALTGMQGVATSVYLLTFAIMYFCVMLTAGLFDPLTGIVVKFMKGDPLRVTVGTVILSTMVSLDGDSTTTFMICCAALLPVYDLLGINRIYLALFAILPNLVVNLLPWGGQRLELWRLSPWMGTSSCRHCCR